MEHTIKLGKGVYRTALSFSKDDMKRATLTLGAAGISHQVPTTATEYAKMEESFGWSANPNVYIPTATAENIKPKPEDFLNVPFRLLSATIVAGGTWRATDFSEAGVLKESLSKLNNKPVYLEHDTNLENLVGIVRSPKWTDAFTNGDGIKVPAGIDGIIAIDTKTNPKIARGVSMGAIFSNSVTVIFDWKPSHDVIDGQNFRDMVGTTHKDGTMIRRVVTVVHDFYESSLVFLGADPFAKLIDEAGNLVHIDEVHSYSQNYSLEPDKIKNLYEKDNRYKISCGLNKEIISLSHQKHYLENFDSKIIDMNPQIIAKLKALLGLSETDEITEQHIETLQKIGAEVPDQTEVTSNALVATEAVSLMKQVDEAATDFAEFSKEHIFVKKDNLATLEAAKVEVETLKVEKEDLTKKLTEAQTLAKHGEELMTAQRVEVERLYRLSAGEKALDGIVDIIKKATMTELNALATQYGGRAMLEFGGKCTKCNSTEISFQSSTQEQDTAPNTKVRKSKSVEEIRAAKLEETKKSYFGI